MTARLILNLKAVDSTPTNMHTPSGLRGKMSDWEMSIVGNIGNEFEDNEKDARDYREDAYSEAGDTTCIELQSYTR